MQYKAIIACRNTACRSADTITFDQVGTKRLTIESVQSTFDNSVEYECDQCGENDWRVLACDPLEKVSYGARD